MQKEIVLTVANALKAYNKADKTGKALLSDLIGKELFTMKITDRVKTFEDACEITGENFQAAKFTQGSANSVAFEKLKTIAEALNEGWNPDWNNSNERKYFPYFIWDSASSGFSFTYVDDYYANTLSSSRLCFQKSDVAEYAAKQFIDLYKDYLK
jgi:hypothetical protein